MLKDYLKDNKISMYKLSKDSGISYATINDIANGRVAIENCRAELLRKISRSLSMNMDKLYDICSNQISAYSVQNNTEITVSVSNKNYYANFIYNNEPVSVYLCNVNEDNTFYVSEIAEWETNAYIRNRKMEDFK